MKTIAVLAALVLAVPAAAFDLPSLRLAQLPSADVQPLRGTAADPTASIVAGGVAEAVFQMDPAQSWPAMKRLAEQVEGAYQVLPDGLGVAPAQAAKRYVAEKGCHGKAECWYSELRFAGAQVRGGVVDYSFTRFLQAPGAEYPYCWVTLKMSTDAGRRLVTSSASQSCTLRHED